MNRRIRDSANVVVLTLLAAAPVIVALELVPGLRGREARSAVAAVERVLALLALAGAAGWAWYGRRNRDSEAAHAAKGGHLSGNGTPGTFATLLPLVPAVAYVLLLTRRAFRGLFLVDKDYAGLSAAIDNTLYGWGPLSTPYFETGATASFLGHHFAPGLFVFAPLYAFGGWLARFAPGLAPGHLLYGLILSGGFAGGLFVWGLVLLESVGPRSRQLCVLLLAFAYPLFRMAQSFHFETLVLLFSGLAVLGLRRDNRVLLGVGVIGWSLWKEDLGLYVALFGGLLLVSRETRTRGFFIGIFGGLSFLVQNLLRSGLAGPTGPDWNYLAGLSARTPHFGAFGGLILAFGGLSLFAPRVLLLGVLPIAALHAWSGHAWHQIYYGHYSYTILPFLLLATAEGAANLEWRLGRRFRPVLFLALALSLYAGGAEKEAPIVPPPEDSRQPVAQALLALLPPGACVQVEARMTAQAPLGVLTVPFLPPRNNPLAERFPDLRHPQRFGEKRIPKRCRGYFVLIDESRAPLYANEHEHALIVRELSRSLQPVERRGSLLLLRARAEPEK